MATVSGPYRPLESGVHGEMQRWSYVDSDEQAPATSGGLQVAGLPLDPRRSYLNYSNIITNPSTKEGPEGTELRHLSWSPGNGKITGPWMGPLGSLDAHQSDSHLYNGGLGTPTESQSSAAIHKALSDEPILLEEDAGQFDVAARQFAEEDMESKWVHRDKLEEIEQQEREEMGVSSGYENEANGSTQKKENLHASTDHRGDVGGRGTAGETPAQLNVLQSRPRTASGRPASSRIPVAAPRQSVEHASVTSSASSRNGSGQFSNDKPAGFSPIAFGTRRASGASQRLSWNGDVSPATRKSRLSTPEPSSGSRPRQRQSPDSPRRPTPSSSPRVTSRGNKEWTTSGGKRKVTPGSRPTSGTYGAPARPVNRPEGPAPWLSEMYKPDPRLPPEEQMLPTHAKRLAQELRQAQERTAPSKVFPALDATPSSTIVATETSTEHSVSTPSNLGTGGGTNHETATNSSYYIINTGLAPISSHATETEHPSIPKLEHSSPHHTGGPAPTTTEASDSSLMTPSQSLINLVLPTTALPEGGIDSSIPANVRNPSQQSVTDRVGAPSPPPPPDQVMQHHAIASRATPKVTSATGPPTRVAEAQTPKQKEGCAGCCVVM